MPAPQLPPDWGKVNVPALRERIDTAIAQTKKRKPAPALPAPVLFIPHYPRYHDGTFRLECAGCSEQFRSEVLDNHELARMLSWQNEHIRSCARKVIDA